MARPTKRTPHVEQRLLAALRAGNTRQAACHSAGIDLHTLARWMGFANFASAIKSAEADAELRAVAIIQQAAQDGTWQAAAWWLERRRPAEYGRQDRVELRVRQIAEQLADELGLSTDEVIAEAERLVQKVA